MALKDKRAKTARKAALPWLALLSRAPRGVVLCDSLACRPENAVGVHEVPDKAFVEARC
jgi:hypothetical protein